MIELKQFALKKKKKNQTDKRQRKTIPLAPTNKHILGEQIDQIKPRIIPNWTQ